MSKFRRRLMALSTLRPHLKDEFVRVEYIESTGTQWIDTLYKPNNKTRIKAKGRYTYPTITASDSMHFLFGVRDGSTFYDMLWNYYGTNSTNTSYGNYLHYGTDIAEWFNDDRNKDVEVDLSYEGGYYNGEKKLTVTDTAKQSKYSLYLLWCNIDGVGQASRKPYGRMYYCKIYEDDVLVRNYIPVLNKTTNKYGMYDLVEQKFYVSPNGAKFVGGREIIYDAEIEYLESTGTQYIETHIIPNASTGVYVKGYKNSGNDNFILGCRKSGGNVRWAIGEMDKGGWYYGWRVYGNSGIYGNPSYIYMNYMNDGLFKVTTPNGTKTMSLLSLSVTPVYNIRLFGTAGVNDIYSKWYGRIYAVQITQGTEIIIDLIPVRVGNVGYMYDKVSNKLFGNDGSGSFILGQDTVVYDKI